MELRKRRKNNGANPKRGYYSEAIAIRGEHDKQKEIRTLLPKQTKLIWQVNTEQYAPIIPRLPKPSVQTFLVSEERWITFGAQEKVAFHSQTLKPKVQHLREVEPGSLPRKVFVERQQRKYFSQNIKDLIHSFNIDPLELIPPEVIDNIFKSQEKYGIYSNFNFLPLELFDNEDYEVRSPEDWMATGMLDNIQHPVPAKAFLPVLQNSVQTVESLPLSSLYEWVDIAVKEYYSQDKLFNCVRLDDLSQSYLIPRIYITFKAEDPENFACRIKDAVDSRNYAQNVIKYQLYIDCMLLSGLDDIKDETIEKVFNLAASSGLRQFSSDFKERLTHELNCMYKRALGEQRFNNTILQYPNIYSFVTIPVQKKKKVPFKACIDTGMIDFWNVRKSVHWQNLYVIQEAYLAMEHVVNKCLNVADMCLYTQSYGKYVSLEEFEAIELQSINSLISFLKTLWLENITHNFCMCLRDVGKGWFNILESRYEIYEISKLSRMMNLILQRMQGALRSLVISSLNMFTDLIERPSLVCLNCPEDFEWGCDLINTQFMPVDPPIFLLFLKMDEQHVFYSTTPEQFEPVLIPLFDNPLIWTHYVRQVHPFILSNLKFPEDLYLSSVGLLEPEVCSMRERLCLCIRKSIIPLIAYSREYHSHIELWKLNVATYISNYEAENHTALEVKEEIAYQRRMKINLEVTLPEKIIIGPFILNVEPLKNFLVSKRQELYIKLLDMFARCSRRLVEAVYEEYKHISVQLSQKPISIEHIFEIKEWMETIPLIVRAQEDLMMIYLTEYEVLDYFWYPLSQEDFYMKWDTIGWPLKIKNQIEETELFLEAETERFLKLHYQDEYDLIEKTDKLTTQVMQLSGMQDIEKVHEVAVECRRMWKTMKECQEKGQLLNQRQRLFGLNVVPFQSLNKLLAEFEPYKNLWITASDWLKSHEIWLDNPMINIDAESIDTVVTDCYKTMQKLTRVFADIPACQNVATEIKSQIEAFRPYISLLLALKNPGLKERHWQDISRISGIEIEMTPTLTFKNCLELGLEEHKETVLKVSEAAAKEFTIEQTLKKMEEEWSNINLEITPYKNTGTYIMKISEEHSLLLDDHIVLTQQLSFSPFKAALETEITEWEEKLHLAQEVIDLWTECQKTWMYLEPIFASEDINRQLPVESKKYSTMERNWRRIMKNAFDHPQIMEICPDKALFESLKECNFYLEQVQKGLSEYLEIKRKCFPRLYFLSDDELLEILAQAKNPLAVQPHLHKCFENIMKLEFKEDLQITAMYSAEGECVNLEPKMYPLGNVEDWLLQVEQTMKNTIRVTMGASLIDINIKQRKDWVLLWPGQIVIAGSQTAWTALIEEGLRQRKLSQKFELMLKMLDDLRELVKGPLKKVERQVLSALIVIEVHARDVTEKLLKENVKHMNDFEWTSQLRYYWVDDAELKVCAVNAEFSYGYEYLGNSGRLVITPLTDRCYLTLIGALHLKFGGAPAGPAGTGKTETTKDLAKAFAIQCVVFNCSDQLDFMAMGKFFKGLASSGAWACFDEFNRIDIEVLSVVAQQITTIQKAQMARLEWFAFEGDEIALKESCAVFITMNPGYAGRTELPDNLKALFRPVAMMVPNYALIAEISLFSFGFSNAKDLARKITTTFKLSSEQLSSQDHYDFGMRAVKTVIAVAGNLKRENPAMDEKQIVLRALKDVNVPKFLQNDLALFQGIVSDLFPEMVADMVDYGVLERAIREALRNNNLEDVNGTKVPVLGEGGLRFVKDSAVACDKEIYPYTESEMQAAVPSGSGEIRFPHF